MKMHVSSLTTGYVKQPRETGQKEMLSLLFPLRLENIRLPSLGGTPLLQKRRFLIMTMRPRNSGRKLLRHLATSSAVCVNKRLPRQPLKTVRRRGGMIALLSPTCRWCRALATILTATHRRPPRQVSLGLLHTRTSVSVATLPATGKATIESKRR